LGLQDLANIGEFISGIVVIVTLAYLAIQVRQNTQSLRTENYARALDRISAMQAKLGQDVSFAQLLSRGASDVSQLSTQERIRLSWCLSEFFDALEFMFHAAERGALPEEVWARWSYTAAYWLSLPGVQSWWRALPMPYTPAFSAFVESTLRDNPFDPQTAARFRDFLLDRQAAGNGSPAA